LNLYTCQALLHSSRILTCKQGCKIINENPANIILLRP
jgi:hypothetical protein